MKHYELNQEYIDRQTHFVRNHGGDIERALALAEHRLNDQANRCREEICRWALQGNTVSQIADLLDDSNAHTLASHPEVISDIYREYIEGMNAQGDK